MEDQLIGIEMTLPPQGWTPMEMIAVVKCVTDSGEIDYWSMKSPRLTAVEAWGMLKQLSMEVQTELECDLWGGVDDDDD